MNEARVVTIPAGKSASLGLLRHLDGVTVADADNRIWLRISRMDEDIEQMLHKLPCAEHFAASPDGRLFPVGNRVPVSRLPDLTWTAIDAFVKPSLPRATLAGRDPSRCGLALQRSSVSQIPNVLVTNLSALAGYGCAAPEVRLNRWWFAVNRDGRALVWGEPLPPLPGQMYVERERVAVPAGWHIAPAQQGGVIGGHRAEARPGRSRLKGLDSHVVAQVLNVGPGELVLFRGDGLIERIGTDDLVRVTRSGLRASLEQF